MCVWAFCWWGYLYISLYISVPLHLSEYLSLYISTSLHLYISTSLRLYISLHLSISFYIFLYLCYGASYLKLGVLVDERGEKLGG